MKKEQIYFALIVTFMYLFSPVYSQGNFSVHVGPSFPLSDFGDDDTDDDDAGLAGVGFNVGGRYLFNINNKGLGLFIEGNFLINGLKSDVKDDVEDELEDEYDDVDIKYPKYINIPLTAGINYTFKANDQLSIYADLGLGVDFFKYTKFKIEADDEEIEATYEWSKKMALRLGGGLLIKDKFIVGLHYNSLGEHKIKGEMEYDGEEENIRGKKIKVSAFTLTAGIKF